MNLEKVMANCLEMYQQTFEYYKSQMPNASNEQVHMAIVGATMIAIAKLVDNGPMNIRFD